MATLNPSADTMLISDGADTNYGTNALVSVGELRAATSVRRSLIKFDLTSYLGNSVCEATLRLYDPGDDYTDNARTMNVYRSIRAWTEDGATWNHYTGTSDWGTVGSGNSTTDYDNNVVGSITMPNPAAAGYVEITLDPKYINEWLDGTLANNGFLLMMATETDDGHVFNSNDAASNKPELVLTFGGGFMAIL